MHGPEGAEAAALDAEVRVAEIVADLQREAAVVRALQVDQPALRTAQLELVALAGVSGLVVQLLALRAFGGGGWACARRDPRDKRT